MSLFIRLFQRFSVILHGKPNAGSHKATNGLDETFCQNLVDKFFQSMGNIKESGTLIVDARNWKGKWYSVYTFWYGHNDITDTADRASYIAVSMIVPGQYVCLVSAVYSLLREAYKENIVGTYLSKSGKYIVQDFNSDVPFEKLYTFLNRNFVNLSESFDNSFKQTSEGTSNSCYNLLDCDSLAFVEDLKKHGRVFVSKTYDSKDSRLTNTDKYIKELQTKDADLSEKNAQIAQLSERITGLEDQIKNKNNSSSKTINEQKEQLEALKKEKETLNGTITKLTTSIEKYQKNEQEIQKILNPGVKETPVSEGEASKINRPFRIKNLISIVNMLLLVVLLVMSCFDSCGNNAMDPDNSSEEVRREIDSLKGIIEEKDVQIKTLNSSAGNFVPETRSDNTAVGIERDENCMLTFSQENKPVKRNEIDKNKPLTIFVGKRIEGYEFYTNNLDAKVSSGTKFTLKKKNDKAPITIVYRSKDKSKCNEANVLTIK